MGYFEDEMMQSNISVYGNESFKVEQMPTKEICMESLDHLRFQTNMIAQNSTGHIVVYCRPKQELIKNETYNY